MSRLTLPHIEGNHSSKYRQTNARNMTSQPLSVMHFFNVACRYDSDNVRVEGDVGMAGVAIDSVEDMKVCD